MISKKAKMVGATVVLAAAGFGITTVASAKRSDSANRERIVHMAPMHDRRNGEHLDAISSLLGITSDELKTELRSGKSLAEIATDKGVDTQKVIDAIVAEMTEKLNEKVAEGKITQAQANTMLANVVDRVTAMVNGEHPARDFGHAEGEKHGRFGGRGHLEVAASALGMTTDELNTELRSGKSLAEIATDKGVDTQKVIDAIVADEKTEIAQAVTDETITQAQADTMLANVVDRVTAMVNGERPARAFGHAEGETHGRFGGRGHRGGFGRGWGAPTTDQNEDA